MSQLIEYVTVLPDAESDERRRKKFPAVCCEILCADIWTITEAVVANHGFLKRICSFLDMDPTSLNEDQQKIVSNCSKIVCSLLMVKLDDVLSFLRTIPRCVEKLVEHLSSPNVIDIILKLISLDGPLVVGNSPTGVCSSKASTSPCLCHAKFMLCPLLNSGYVKNIWWNNLSLSSCPLVRIVRCRSEWPLHSRSSFLSLLILLIVHQLQK